MSRVCYRLARDIIVGDIVMYGPCSQGLVLDVTRRRGGFVDLCILASKGSRIVRAMMTDFEMLDILNR